MGLLARALRPFGHVDAAEAATVVVLLANVLLLLLAYYVLKTIREPLILAGGAELKSYAAAAQAVALVAFVPAYSWLTARLDRRRLIVVVVLFFAANVEAFWLGSRLGVPHLGFVFYVWVGIFSLASISLFWSYANDLYSPEAGKRLFPVIAIGAAVGGPLGSKVAERLFAAGVSPYRMMHVAAALLLVHLALYLVVDRREGGRVRRPAPPERAPGVATDGFGLVLRSPYLRLIAALLVLLNVVNTTGEYVLGRSVVEAANAAAAASPGLDPGAYIGAFYGRYFFWVNVGSGLLQAFAVSRLVDRLGMRGVIFALPLVAFGAYGLVAAGAGLAVLRWAKTAENMVDYSVNNTGRQLLWLPTTRQEKYAAKQAIDTFFVRLGDLGSAALVWAGTHLLGAGIPAFGAANLVLVVAWGATAWALARRYDLALASAPADAAQAQGRAAG